MLEDQKTRQESSPEPDPGGNGPETTLPLPVGHEDPGLQAPAPKRKGRRLARKAPQEKVYQAPRPPEERLMLLDVWQRSGLSAGDFGTLVGLSAHSLYGWKKRFEAEGPAGLMDQPKGQPKGCKVAEVTKRAILMLKTQHPEWGCQRISDMLARGPALPASAKAVGKVLKEAGYELEEVGKRAHAVRPVKHFERAKANQLWQTDIFTFILKRQNRRLYLIAFMDDHSRYIVSYGLHGTATAPLVLEVLQAGIASYGPPEEVLTDNGPQYVTWRGKSAFTKGLEKMGVKQIVATPKRPQTLGKLERFWGSLWSECVEQAVFLDLEDARKRIGLYIDYYNFQRTHQGIEGLVPADRFFGAAPEVLKSLKERVKANAAALARHGSVPEQLYLTGQLGGKQVSLHGKGGKVILRQEGEEAKEVALDAEEAGAVAAEEIVVAERREREDREELPEPVCPAGVVAGLDDEHELVPPPGVSPVDELMKRMGVNKQVVDFGSARKGE